MNLNIKNKCKTCEKETLLSVCIECLNKKPSQN